MSDKKIKVKLDVYSTYGGEDFPPGEHEVSEEAAKSFEEKKLGVIVGKDSTKKAEDSSLKVDKTDVFEAKEAVEKYLEGDSSEKVFNSLKTHQTEIIDLLKAEGERLKNDFGKPAQNLEETAKEVVNDGQIGADKTEVKEEIETKKNQAAAEDKSLPEDFPSLAKFKKLGFKTVDEVQKLTTEHLVSLGISESTAEKALSFGK